MTWLNIQTSFLRSPEFMGSDPVQRATWLALLGFCCEQENGGRIEDCLNWGDRRWQQTCGVTLIEIQSCCDLWFWENADVVLFAYPAEKEAEVIGKRKAGAKGGKASGKARKKAINEAPRESVLQAACEAELQAQLERKGKEGNGKEEEEEEEEKRNKSRGSRIEIDDFFRSIDLTPRDAEYMWNNWESNGWTIKGKALKDWRATARAWKAAGHMPSQKASLASDVWPIDLGPNINEMTPEERIIHYRKGYPERDWPFIMEDGYLDLIAKGLHIKAAKEEARRISEGIEPDDLEPTPKGELW